MRLPLSLTRVPMLLLAPLLTLSLAACGSTVSTSSFKGEEHEVAQTVANLQADSTAGEQSKICANDLSQPVVSKLATVTGLGGKKGCEKAIKDQLAEIDNLELSVKSIKLGPAAGTATATVQSTYAGKKRLSTVSLVKEGGKWKISAFG